MGGKIESISGFAAVEETLKVFLDSCPVWMDVGQVDLGQVGGMESRPSSGMGHIGRGRVEKGLVEVSWGRCSCLIVS